MVEPRPMKEYTLPTISNHPSCIVLPPCAIAFDIKPGTIANLPIFFGLPSNEPYLHLQEFNEVCSTVQLLGIDEGNLHLRLFPFSLKDKAKKWLYKLPPSSIHTWEEMQRVFLKFYFPPHKSNSMRNELMNFRELPNESFYETCERFKDIEDGVPNHGLSKVAVLSAFYTGLSQDTRRRVDNACGGCFMNKIEDEAMKILDEMSESSKLFDSASDRKPMMMKSAQVPMREQEQRRGMYNVDIPSVQMQQELKRIEGDMQKKLDMILQAQGRPLNQMASPSQIREPSLGVKAMEQACLICESVYHSTTECSQSDMYPELIEQCNLLDYQTKLKNDPYSNTYNPGWRNHPNFGWGGNQNREQGQGYQRQRGGYQGASSSHFNNQGAHNAYHAPRPPYQAPSQ
ncbi:uncharacterized protein LOC112203807 [Rosa chinensis]|uniref:uncharacterized protein LOC112203807 n=1 Tax=Rosa chinensis TaxID=74649 RepID=UPI000D08985B|nr:uncharacterized protein LOC112203807 [Rosa chinensis]